MTANVKNINNKTHLTAAECTAFIFHIRNAMNAWARVSGGHWQQHDFFFFFFFGILLKSMRSHNPNWLITKINQHMDVALMNATQDEMSRISLTWFSLLVTICDVVFFCHLRAWNIEQANKIYFLFVRCSVFAIQWHVYSRVKTHKNTILFISNAFLCDLNCGWSGNSDQSSHHSRAKYGESVKRLMATLHTSESKCIQ